MLNVREVISHVLSCRVVLCRVMSCHVRACYVMNAKFKGPAKQIQHIDTTSSNIVESKMLHLFGHHVARCCLMLDDVEQTLIPIKRRFQHRQTFLSFSGVNNNVAFVWPLCSIQHC